MFSSSISQALEPFPSPIINATVAQRHRRTSYYRSSTPLHLLLPVINAAAPAARRSSSVTVIAVTLMDAQISTSSNLLDNKISAEPSFENEVTESDLTPYVGMEFETEEHAYRFYNAYAGFIGFSVRKHWTNKSRVDQITILSQKFVCFKEGFKKKRDCEAKRVHKDIRTGCLAQMIVGRQPNGKYVVTYFEKQHNHALATPRSRHKLPSQRKLSAAQATQIELANQSGIRQKLIFEFMSRQVGGRENVGCTLKDVSNHLSSKRTKEMKEGEAYTLLHYFQSRQSENPSFFYDIQLDAEDQITNIFWADAEMVVDYVCFGDVVSFDTTYRTNKNCRPFAPFVGFNHHRQTVIFGAALLYDETAESFEWLFKTFLKAMCGKKPKTIFTDQDAAMAKAISMVLPDSYHRLCTWHLFQNALKNVNHAFKKSDSFASDLRCCIYDYEYEDEFLNAWESILDKHDLRQNKWMQDLFQKKEKWASVYGRHTFSAGATSTQLSESFNGRLRDILLLKSARNIYTPTIYHQVLEEYEKSCNMIFKEYNQVSTLFGYKVCLLDHPREHNVTFNSEDETVVCSCKKFEFIGILCGHALHVLHHWNKIVIPEKYILKRWTKNARSGCVMDNNGRIIKEDPNLAVSNRFKDLSRNAVQIASKAAKSDDALKFFSKKLVELSMKIDKILTSVYSSDHHEQGEETNAIEKNVIQVKGMKKKDGLSRVKGRPKSCVEKPKKKRCSQVLTPSSELVYHVPTSAVVSQEYLFCFV
ncbi:protein FAR1-RELATED SEQUENCE 5-like [Senna tora]|uniref:Protein FAR1-RELATED SEQUENCE 5-like n=1 Tax=Senna tora TaxID=362788 RepID=A0A834SDJ8_9FABA|nr:protein FAR1-RELATED SEQUENCE 5-like [Senna tora]